MNFLEKSLEIRCSKKWERFQELHYQELQTNRWFNEKPNIMLPIPNENNYSGSGINKQRISKHPLLLKILEGMMLPKPHQKHKLLKWKTLMYLHHFWIIWVGYLKKILQIIVWEDKEQKQSIVKLKEFG